MATFANDATRWQDKDCQSSRDQARQQSNELSLNERIILLDKRKEWQSKGKSFTNSDFAALAMQEFGKTISTSSVSRVLKDEAKWRQKHVEIGKASSRSAKRTRILCSESLNTLVAQRCQKIEKSNGRLSEALIKQIGQHLIF